MPALKAKFEQAVADSTSCRAPDNQTLLQIYALYKQATVGDTTGDRPGFMDLVGRAKWDAWKAVEGKSPNEAMQAYVDLNEIAEIGTSVPSPNCRFTCSTLARQLRDATLFAARSVGLRAFPGLGRGLGEQRFERLLDLRLDLLGE